MGFQNSNNLLQGAIQGAIQGALRQAELTRQYGRSNSLTSQQKNVQLFRVSPGNSAQAAGGDSLLDSSVYSESPAGPAAGQNAAAAGSGTAPGAARTAVTGTFGTAKTGTSQPVVTGTSTAANAGMSGTASAPARSKVLDDSEKLLKLNFNEENLLSGIVMAEVLGRPKCLRRGRW